MVRIIVGALLLLVVSIPAAAQDDYPKVEMSLGYGNIGFAGIPFVSCNPPDCESSRRSGFASTQGFNFKSWLGVENSLGYYSLGNRLSLLSNTFGAKFAYRGGGPIVPYGIVGIGGGSVMSEQTGGGDGGLNTRLGVGVEWGANDGMRLKVDVSRIGSKYFKNTIAEVSQGSIAISVGVAFTLMN